MKFFNCHAIIKDTGSARGRSHFIFSALLEVPQPHFKLLQRDFSLLALPLFLPGPLAPGIDLLRQNLPGLDPGKAFFVFPAVELERLVAALIFRP